MASQPPDPAEQLDALVDDLTTVVAAISRLAGTFVTLDEERRFLDDGPRRAALESVLAAARRSLEGP